MKTLREIEKEFDLKWWGTKGIPEKDGESVKQFYRQAIKEILEEVAGSDETKIRFEDEQYPCEKDFNRGWNGAKAEIRENFKKLLNE